MKELVQSFETTMDTMQQTHQDIMLETIKAFTDKGLSQKETTNLGIQKSCFPTFFSRQLLQNISLQRREQTNTTGSCLWKCRVSN